MNDIRPHPLDIMIATVILLYRYENQIRQENDLAVLSESIDDDTPLPATVKTKFGNGSNVGDTKAADVGGATRSRKTSD